jgi:hypothetical protein
METPSLPTREDSTDEATLAHKRGVKRALANIARDGKVNWVLEGTLVTGTTSTVFTSDSVSTKAQISISPVTPEAAALLGKVWIPSATLVPGNAFSGSPVGKFTVQHPNLLPGVVATFRFCVKG